MSEITQKILPPRVFGLKGWIHLSEEQTLEKLFSEYLAGAGFKILDYSVHHFPVNGFTAFWLLAESHLALHTFPESGWCYIELSSCNGSKAMRFKQQMLDTAYAIIWENEELDVCAPGGEA
jgi:S-adenosylmethionine decarboxylase